jgi:ketosteroid isomerase-like protein
MPKNMLVIAALASLAGCSSHSSNSAAHATRAAAHGIIAAFNRQDAHAAAAFDAPDYVGIFHGTANTLGMAADEAAMKAQMASAKVDWQLGKENVTVAKAGDIGVFEAPYTFVINIPGAPITTERGTWTAIFKRQPDGSMKLWRSIASDGPAPTSSAGTPSSPRT